jgi:hypothetical protein
MLTVRKEEITFGLKKVLKNAAIVSGIKIPHSFAIFFLKG